MSKPRRKLPKMINRVDMLHQYEFKEKQGTT